MRGIGHVQLKIRRYLAAVKQMPNAAKYVFLLISNFHNSSYNEFCDLNENNDRIRKGQIILEMHLFPQLFGYTLPLGLRIMILPLNFLPPTINPRFLFHTPESVYLPID